MRCVVQITGVRNKLKITDEALTKHSFLASLQVYKKGGDGILPTSLNPGHAYLPHKFFTFFFAILFAFTVGSYHEATCPVFAQGGICTSVLLHGPLFPPPYNLSLSFLFILHIAALLQMNTTLTFCIGSLTFKYELKIPVVNHVAA